MTTQLESKTNKLIKVAAAIRNELVGKACADTPITKEFLLRRAERLDRVIRPILNDSLVVDCAALLESLSGVSIESKDPDAGISTPTEQCPQCGGPCYGREVQS